MPFESKAFRVETWDGRTFRLIDSIVYTAENKEVITIPAGSTSDGASTPRAGWNVLPPFGDYWRAAFLHDFLYRDTDKPKVECDNLLLEAMASLNVFRLERDFIYQGVVNFGQASFDIDRKIKK